MITLEKHLAAHAEIVRSLPDEHACSCGYGLGASDGRVTVRWRAHVAEAWREARTVRTVKELDTLPVGAVIRCGYGVVREATADRLSPEARHVRQSWTGFGDLGLPALVVWTPEDGAA